MGVLAAGASVAGPQPELVSIPGGRFAMGDAAGEPDEAPRAVVVRAFRMMRHEVTNREFAAFVAATGYVTDAERSGAGYVWTDRWRSVRGAEWRHPQGPTSTIVGLEDHPIVQASARDAAAYCAWLGLRLPTEAEWEFAARSADGRRYPWGNERPQQRGERRANFGAADCCAPDGSDGFLRTAPVGSFPRGASPYGLQDMAGNGWEWTASPYRGEEVALRGGGWGNDPYCLRAAYRHGNPPDIGLDTWWAFGAPAIEPIGRYGLRPSDWHAKARPQACPDPGPGQRRRDPEPAVEARRGDAGEEGPDVAAERDPCAIAHEEPAQDR
jgi:formylglycine-generating enzyme required for sulfatase activity